MCVYSPDPCYWTVYIAKLSGSSQGKKRKFIIIGGKKKEKKKERERIPDPSNVNDFIFCFGFLFTFSFQMGRMHFFPSISQVESSWTD